MAVAVALAGILAATSRSTRITIGVLGALTVVGVPWIVSPLIAGITWWLLEHRHDARVDLHNITARLRPIPVIIVMALGLVAGLIAVPFVRDQANLTPIVFDIVTPPTALLIAAVVLLAIANAIGEELLWRGALLEGSPTLRPPLLYALQAVSFGVAHWRGLPGGTAGCLLAATASMVFLYIHNRWGMIASIAAHLLADIVIFTAVLPLVLFTGWATY